MDSTKLLTEEEALGVLGPRRFLGRRQVVDCWNRLKKNKLRLRKGIRIPYPKELITELSKKKMWRLVFDPGFSLIQLREIIGEECSSRLCFCVQNRWWLENQYASEGREPGYILIKIKPDFCDLRWQEQEQRMGGLFRRAPVSLVLNTILSISLSTKNSSFSSLDHWGTESDHKETRCAFGIRERGCIFLYNRRTDSPHNELGVCLFKNPVY